MLTGLDQARLEALARYGGRPRASSVLTGESWAVLAGSRSRLSALARPWIVPAPARRCWPLAVGHAMPPDAGHPSGRRLGAPSSLERPVLVGILNVTPDSFSDGGRFAAICRQPLAHAERSCRTAGAAIIDVGGESTRPGRADGAAGGGAPPGTIPVDRGLVRDYPDLLLSIDTVKASGGRAALDAGAAIVNDVSALRLDPDMAAVVAAARAGLVLMHSRGGDPGARLLPPCRLRRRCRRRRGGRAAGRR